MHIHRIQITSWVSSLFIFGRWSNLLFSIKKNKSLKQILIDFTSYQIQYLECEMSCESANTVSDSFSPCLFLRLWNDAPSSGTLLAVAYKVCMCETGVLQIEKLSSGFRTANIIWHTKKKKVCFLQQRIHIISHIILCGFLSTIVEVAIFLLTGKN